LWLKIFENTKWSWGPLVSRSCHLTGHTGRTRMHTQHRVRWHDGDRMPPVATAHGSPASLSSTQLHREARVSFLLFSINAQPCSALPSIAARCRPTGPKGAPWCHAPPAPSSSPGDRLPRSSNRGSCTAVYLHEELTIDRHCLSTSIHATTSRRTTRVHSSTTSTPSPLTTSGTSCHRRPPPLFSLTAARPLWWDPLHPTTTHRFPMFQSSSPTPPSQVSRRRSAGIDQQSRTGEGGEIVPCFSRGLSHCGSNPSAQCRFLFSIHIYSFQI
jgi:hypothetical protein